MTEINITPTKMSLRRNSYQTFEDAIQHAGNNDTITIHDRKLKITAPEIDINKSLFIRGSNPQKPTAIYVNGLKGQDQVMMGLVAGDLHMSNVNIYLGHQASGIVAAPGYQGSITLSNVSIWHDKGITQPQEYYPSIALFNSNSNTSILNASINLKHCDIDNAQIAAVSLNVSDSSILGRLDGKQSILMCKDVEVQNSELTHLYIENDNPDQNGMLLQNIFTKGLLSLVGNFGVKHIEFLNGVHRTSRPLGFLGADPLKVLNAYGIKSPMPFLELSSFKGLKNKIIIDGIKYDQSLYQMQESDALVHPYSFNFYGVGAVLKNLKILPNVFGEKNVTTAGSMSMENVIDKSHWSDKDTALTHRGHVESELFSRLPDITTGQAKAKKDPIIQLKHMIGLKSAKRALIGMIARAKYDHANHLQNGAMHMIFEGDPGTGKTTVARLFSRALYQGGVIKKAEPVETEGSHLMGQYVGQTRGVVDKLVGEARGGVLFIDEAYELSPKPGQNDSFASQAVTELVAQMENHRNDLIVIMAGYTHEMNYFLQHGNSGLISRFPYVIKFNNYTPNEMKQILQLMINKNHLQINNTQTTGAAMVKGLYDIMNVQRNGKGGNGRLVRSYVNQMITQMATRLSLTGGNLHSKVLTEPDVVKAVNMLVQKANNIN